MVSSDVTTSLQHHTRKIILNPGRTVSTKKSALIKRRSFMVEELVLLWHGDQEPTNVTAHGHYVSKLGHKIHARRVYDLADAPKWIKDAING